MADSNIQKLFVSVPSNKVDDFLGKVFGTPAVLYTYEEYKAQDGNDAVTEAEFAALTDAEKTKTPAVDPVDATVTKYADKVCFLGNSGQIYAKGNLYGAKGSDVTELKAILAGFDSNGTDPDKKTVAAAIEAAKKAVLGTATTSAAETQTIGAVSDRVKSIENLIAVDTNGDIDKLQEVLNWFSGVSDAAGTYKVTVGEGADAEEVELGVGQAGLLSTVAENKLAIGEKGTTYTAAEAAAKNAESGAAEGDANYVKEGDEKTPATGLYKEIADAVAASNSAIDELDSTVYSGGADATAHAASTDYVKVTVAQEDGKLKSVSVSAPIKSLADVVGLTKVTDGENAGKWIAPDGTVAEDGLVTAADVATEIIADEAVIAAALNDHESRLAAVEGGNLTIAEVSKTDDDAKNVTVTVKTQNGSVSDVAVDVTEATYTASSTGDGSIGDGLVTAATLSSIFDDIWETYSE